MFPFNEPSIGLGQRFHFFVVTRGALLRPAASPESRTQLSLAKYCPEPRSVCPLGAGRIIAFPRSAAFITVTKDSRPDSSRNRLGQCCNAAELLDREINRLTCASAIGSSEATKSSSWDGTCIGWPGRLV